MAHLFIILSPWWQEVRQAVAEVRSVLHNIFCSWEGAGVHQGVRSEASWWFSMLCVFFSFSHCVVISDCLLSSLRTAPWGCMLGCSLLSSGGRPHKLLASSEPLTARRGRQIRGLPEIWSCEPFPQSLLNWRWGQPCTFWSPEWVIWFYLCSVSGLFTAECHNASSCTLSSPEMSPGLSNAPCGEPVWERGWKRCGI